MDSKYNHKIKINETLGHLCIDCTVNPSNKKPQDPTIVTEP